MGIFNRKPPVPEGHGRSAVAVQPSAPVTSLTAKMDPKGLVSRGGLEPDIISGVSRTQQSSLAALTLGGEAALHSWWLHRTAPWMSSPAVLAIANVLANAVARLPVFQVDAKGNKTPLPDMFDYPLTKEDNPTFNRADLFKMIVHCLMRYGTAHILITYNNKGEVVRIRPLDSWRVQTHGTFVKPYWKLISRSSLWHNFAGGAVDDDDLPTCKIYPDGRKKGKGPEKRFGMLLICLNRTPESNNGAPPGLITADSTVSMLAALKHAAEFFTEGTKQKIIATPHHASHAFKGWQEAATDLSDALKDGQGAVMTTVPWETRNVGYSAKDSQLIESREFDMAAAAIAYGLPAGMFSSKGQSYAQVYADSIRQLTDGVEPILIELEHEFTRLLDPGQKMCFDRNAAMRADPFTATKIAAELGKSGYITPDEGRDITGYAPFNADWSKEAYVDGGRRPVSSLADIAEAQVAKNKMGETGRPSEGGEQLEYPEVPG